MGTPEFEELEQKLSALRKQEYELIGMAEQLVEKRDKLNDRSRILREETSKLKSERDTLNLEVKELKETRANLKTEIHNIIEQLKPLHVQANNLAKSGFSRDAPELQRRLERIEWEIQTTSMDLQQEKEMLNHVKLLEAQMTTHRKLLKVCREIDALEAQLKVYSEKSETCHDLLTQKAQRSQEIHQNMLARVAEMANVRTEADEFHRHFVETKTRISDIRQAMKEVSDKIRCMKNQILEQESVRKMAVEEAARASIKKQASEKLKKGGRLTWQEFQVLNEEGTQDEK